MCQLCKTLDKAELGLFCDVVKGDWIAQEKFDGDRIRLMIKGGKVSLFNRRGKNVTEQYPELHNLTHEKDLFIDGEMCVLNDKGVSVFNEGIAFRSHCKTEQAINSAMLKFPVTYIIFDIMEYDGEQLRGMPLKGRTEILRDVFNRIIHPNIQIAETYSDIKGAWDDVISKGGEGIIVKDSESTYHEGKRHSSWRKVKDIKEVVLTFRKYQEHPKGVRVETDDEIAITVNGWASQDVKRDIDTKGECKIEIRHLGQTANSKFRQPVFFRRLTE